MGRWFGNLMRLTAFFLLLLAVANFATAQEYTLNAGDTLRIHVYGEPDLSFPQLLVGQNGRISYPFLGELRVSGKSVGQVQDMLLAGLKPDYLVDPRVSVGIVRYRAFFVNGEVRSPGSIEFQPGLTLRKAITLAGGFTERANRKEMLLVKDGQLDKEAQKVDLDYRIQPGDTVTVRDTFF